MQVYAFEVTCVQRPLFKHGLGEHGLVSGEVATVVVDADDVDNAF